MSNRKVTFEVTVPTATIAETVDPDHFRTLATVADQQGFDAISTGDHITIPDDVPNEYPFSPSGESPLDSSDAIHEIFLALADVCQTTRDIRLGTNVCVVPYRHPLVLARQVLTLVSLSDGRFEFGVGVGWLRTEFEALGVPFEERGSRTDEFLDLFGRVCRDGTLSFDGPHHSFRTTGLHPVPDDPPPILVGGHSSATFRRVAQHGDGWTIYWLRPGEIRTERARLLQAWKAHNRDGEPEIAVTRPVNVGTDTGQDTSRPLVGPPEKVIEDIERYIDAGVTRIVLALGFFQSDLDSQIRQLGRFAEDVMVAFDG